MSGLAKIGCVLVLALSGCDCGSDVELVDDAGGDMDGSRADTGAPPIPGLRALRIDPPSETMTTDGVDPAETASFRAIGTFADGDRDVTAEVIWSLSNLEIGTIAAGAFTSAGVGGRSDVVAAAGDISARADLTVTLEVTVVVEGAPPGAPAMFPTDTSGDMTMGADAIRIVYPSHETMFPRNLERVNHQWDAGAALDLFELRFDSDFARIRWYTTDRSFTPDLDGWRWLAATHAGSSLTFTVRGLATASPATIHRSQDVTLLYSASEVIGALYYWSTGAAGVMRATISSPIATKFYANPDIPDDTCVSCHTVSRDGRRLFVNYGGENAHVASIPDRDVLIPPMGMEEQPGGWATFNPGATRLLYSARGTLRLLDPDTGAEIAPVTLPTGFFAQHPDWAPDGNFVAIVYSMIRPDNKKVEGTSLARMPVNPDGTFGEPEILVASTADDDTISFPSYSPDSRWIAFVRQVGGSKDNPTQTMWLVAADGSGEPIPVTRLNERVRDEDGIVDIGNNMPTWAPSTRPDIFWLAFSSLRAYGNVIPGGGRDQLWGVAIDPMRIGMGDASYAAFWMPFQDVEEGNHRAFWALNPDDVCPSTVELCDGFDNDCDGIVDEMCCTPVAEMCGNMMDDDCDGEADEGCMCMPDPPEDCGNMLDDDCDGLIDSFDEDCLI